MSMGAGMVMAWTGAAGVAAGVGVLAHGMFSPRSRLLGPVVFRGTTEAPARVALTFDDGPDGDVTPRILDRLGEAGVAAAFFVIGRNVEQHPALVERIHREGHLVGNHSYHHAWLGTMRRLRYWRDELARTDDLIEPLIGARPVLFRPPMGFRNWHMTRAVREGRYVSTTWTLRALDGRPTTADRIARRLVPRATAGAIIALHDGHEPGRHRDLGPTIDALPRIIAGLRDRGLEPARLDELLGQPAYRHLETVPGTAPAPADASA